MHGIEEAANLVYASKLMEDTSATDIPMADIVSQLQTEGYDIYAAPGSGITGIQLDNNSLTMKTDGTISINVTYEGNTEGIQYYAVVRGKYYLMTKDENGITVSRKATDINGSEAEELKAESSDNSYVKVEEISGDTIKLKAGSTVGTATITVTYGSYTAECIVSVVTTSTEDSEANPSIRFSTSYGTIDVIWLTEDNQVTSTPNVPVLASNGEAMTPVTWTYNEGTKTWTEDGTASSNWYSYNSVSKRGEDGKLVDNTTSKWANAKTANGSYFVWIPRYAYRITYYENETSTEPTGYYDGWGMWKTDGSVKYKLDEGIETVEYKGNKYIIHPAFCDGSDNGYANGEWDSNLSGFWFAKYEMSNFSDLQSIPNVASLETTIGAQYIYARRSTFGYTGTASTIMSGGTEYTNYMDSHLVKNSEWGAVAYLTQSQYGRNGNEISVNQCEVSVTKGYTGAGRGEGENKVYNSKYSSTDITDAQKYNGELGVLSSTTGNVYGIYDMSGGVWEYTAGFDKLSTSTDLTTRGAGMTKEAKDKDNNYISTKYITTYSNGTDSNSGTKIYDICKTGEAIKETQRWFNDWDEIAYSRYAFFGRGGAYFGAASGMAAGVFSSNDCNADGVSRVVLCP